MSSPSPAPTGGEERHEAGEDNAPSRGGCASSPRRAGTGPSCGAADVGAGGGGGGGDAALPNGGGGGDAALPNGGGGGDAAVPSGGGFVRVEAAVEQRVSLVELRAFLREAQRLLGLASFDELDLLTHELVKNALALGEPEVRVAVARRDGGVRVEVRDYGYGLPVLDSAEAEEPSFGLKIVDRLADRWGVDQFLPGKIVWFELDGRHR